MNIGPHDIGVCSWSLRSPDTPAMIAAVRSLGLEHVQLALGDLLFLDDKRKHFELGLLRESGLIFTAGMIGFPGENYSTIATIHETGGLLPDAQWPVRKKLTISAGGLAAEMGLSRLSSHIGFIPLSSDGRYRVIADRVREIAAALADMGVDLLLETGQEQAAVLLQFLNDLACRNVGVNFDPANMILYGAGDPIEAIGILGRHIRHVHIKDARLSSQPGVTWGEEAPFGTGEVGPSALLRALGSAGYTGPLLIEREGGSNRVGEVRAAVEALRDANG